MRVVIIGGTGIIGRAVTNHLIPRHEVIQVGNTSGDFQVDVSDKSSIEKLFKGLPPFNALVCITGRTKFMPLDQMREQDYLYGIENKLMGQVNLVLEGIKYIEKNGSFTLTSGLLNYDPIPNSSSAAMIDGAIEGFARAAAIEINPRINVVSPMVIEEALDKYGDAFLGYKAIPAKEAALGYIKSIEGKQTGQVYRVGW